MDPDLILAVDALRSSVERLSGMLYGFCLIQTFALSFYFGLSRP